MRVTPIHVRDLGVGIPESGRKEATFVSARLPERAPALRTLREARA